MDKIKYWLRWIAVFPGALLAGLIATFPLHWILYSTFANGEIISGVNIEPIERTLSPFVIAVVFILAGYEIAPKYKFKTAIVLFVIYVILWLATVIMTFFPELLYGIKLQFSGRSILAIVGAILGLYIAKESDEKK